MKFKQKIFLAIFATSALILVIAGTAIFFEIERRLEDQYYSRYEKLASVVSKTLKQLEQNVEYLSESSLRYLRLYEKNNGTPSNERLATLAERLNVSRLYVINREGRFIRDSEGVAPQQETTLYDYCEGYRDLVTGESDFAKTPIVPSKPYTGPYMFVMMPTFDRSAILEIGMKLEFIGNVLGNVLASDDNVLSVGLFSPTGQELGYISKEGTRFNKTPNVAEELGQPIRVDRANKTVTFLTRMKASVTHCCECRVKKVASADGTYYYALRLQVALSPLLADISRTRTWVMVAVVIALVFALVLAHVLSRVVVRRLQVIDEGMDKIMTSGDLSQRLGVRGKDEAAALAKRFDLMTAKLEQHQKELVEAERHKALGQMASQVAHDIRSPLASFDMLLSTIKSLDERQRVVLRTATQRIRDIANNLLSHSRPEVADSDVQSEVSSKQIPMLVSSIASEKRLQYGNRPQVEIEIDPDLEARLVFCEVNPSAFKRALSNLVDNGVEALPPDGGRVTLGLEEKGSFVVVSVTDNGVGMTEDLVQRIFDKPTSVGKSSGHGFGLKYVREQMDLWGGKMEIHSEPTQGTRVDLSLPAADPPFWFARQAHLLATDTVVVVDDDESAHHIWDDRFTGQNEVLHFRSLAAFKARFASASVDGYTFFVDFEFVGESDDGIQALQELGLVGRSYLVTSRLEEPEVIERCEASAIQVIPKGLASWIPIKKWPQRRRPACVLVDDDVFIRESWQHSADQVGATVDLYSRPQDLLEAAPSYGRETPIYIDESLGEGIRGQDMARRLHKLGFRELYLATGFTEDYFDDLDVIKGLTGKEPPPEIGGSGPEGS